MNRALIEFVFSEGVMKTASSTHKIAEHSPRARRGKHRRKTQANCGPDAGSLDGGGGEPSGRRSVKLFLGSTVHAYY